MKKCWLLTSAEILRLFILVLLILGAYSAAHAQTLAQTPPMGWNSWNKFACHVNEQLIRETEEGIV